MVTNQLTVWSIMFFMMLAPSAIPSALLAVEQVFASVSAPGVDLTAPKLAFIGAQCIGVLIVLWKLNAMGLLPLTSADWVSSCLLSNRWSVPHSDGRFKEVIIFISAYRMHLVWRLSLAVSRQLSRLSTQAHWHVAADSDVRA